MLIINVMNMRYDMLRGLGRSSSSCNAGDSDQARPDPSGVPHPTRIQDYEAYSSNNSDNSPNKIILGWLVVAPAIIYNLIDGHTCLFLDRSIKRPLDKFVRHYEHIHYDKDSLMHNHARVRRSNSADNGISLSFNGFDRWINCCSCNWNTEYCCSMIMIIVDRK